MSEPIISPWIFYLIDVSQGILSFSFFIAVVTFMGMGIEKCVNEREGYSPLFKILYLMFIVASLLSIFIPTKETIMQMMIASVITPENIQIVGEGTEVVASKVFDVIIEGATKLIQEVKK